MTPYELEEKIMSCWGVTGDIDLLRRAMMDGPGLSADELDNFLLGVKMVYELRFQELFGVYEKMLREGNLK